MLRLLRPAVLVPVLAASGALLAGCGANDTTGSKPVVVATAPQLDGMLQELAGSGVTVKPVVSPTADIHDVELRPSQVRALRDAKLILRPGRGNDAWADEALGQVTGEQVDVSADLGGDQRHWWMDPTLALKAATQIKDRLDTLDPSGAGARDAAYAALERELQTVDRETEACLASVPPAKRKIVTDHDAAGAFAERYGLSVVGTISPGAEPEAAPSAQRVAELVKTMRAEGVAALFPIAPHGSALAKTIAERGGATLGAPLWADALPGATHDHGDEDHADADAGTPGAHADEAASTIESAARLNAESVSEALGATGSACRAFHG
ncbi:MAG: metal ABC transporter substrate-binding protein [Patulibacter minatonensis]